MAYLLYTADFLASLSPSLYIHAFIRVPTHACVPSITCAVVLTYHISLSDSMMTGSISATPDRPGSIERNA